MICIKINKKENKGLHILGALQVFITEKELTLSQLQSIINRYFEGDEVEFNISEEKKERILNHLENCGLVITIC